MILVILSIFIFIIAASIGWKATKNTLSPIFISMGLFFLFYIGGIIYFINNHHYLTPLYISIGVLLYSLGTFTASGFAHFNPEVELKNFKQKPFFEIFPSKKIFFISLISVFIISVILIFLYYYYTGILLFKEQAERTILHGGNGIFFRGMTTFLPLILLMTYLFQKITKKFSIKLFWWIVMATSLVSIFLYGSRGLALRFLIPFLLLYSLIRTKYVKRKIVIILLIFILIAIGFQYLYPEYQNSSSTQAFTIFFNRLTVDQVKGIDYIIYKLVPDQGLFMGKRLIIDFRGILSTLRIVPREVTFEEWLFRKMDPRYIKEAMFTISTTTIGDLYVDFGIIGIIFGMYFYGLIAQSLYIKSIRGTKNIFLLVVYSYLQYILIAAHIGGGIFGTIANYGISLIAFIFIIISINFFLLLPVNKLMLKFPRNIY